MEGTASNIVWDAFEAFVRGIFLSLSHHKKEKRNKVRADMLKDFRVRNQAQS